MSVDVVTAAVLLALAAAVAFGLASALQHAGVQRAEPLRTARIPPVGRLLREPRWLAGCAADVVGVCLQSAALRYGPVTLVTPLLVTGLVTATVARPVLDGRRPSRAACLASAACAACLAGLLLTTSVGAGSVRLSPAGLFSLGGLGAVLAGAAPAAARRCRTDGSRASVLAAAAGGLMGLSAIPLRVVAAGVAETGLFGLWTWSSVLLVGLGGGGWLLAQAAFAAGPLPAPLAVLTSIEPAVAAAGGRLALHEPVAAQGIRAWVAVALIATLISTVIVLAYDDRTLAPRPS